MKTINRFKKLPIQVANEEVTLSSVVTERSIMCVNGDGHYIDIGLNSHTFLVSQIACS